MVYDGGRGYSANPLPCFSSVISHVFVRFSNKGVAYVPLEISQRCVSKQRYSPAPSSCTAARADQAPGKVNQMLRL